MIWDFGPGDAQITTIKELEVIQQSNSHYNRLLSKKILHEKMFVLIFAK